MKTGPAYSGGSLGVVRLHFGQGIDAVEVKSSSLLVPTRDYMRRGDLVNNLYFADQLCVSFAGLENQWVAE